MLTALLQRDKPPPLNECHKYDTKLSNGEAPVLLELWRMWSTPSLTLLLGPHYPGVVATVMVISMDQIELFNHLTVLKQMTDIKLNCYCFIAMLETI